MKVSVSMFGTGMAVRTEIYAIVVRALKGDCGWFVAVAGRVSHFSRGVRTRAQLLPLLHFSR